MNTNYEDITINVSDALLEYNIGGVSRSMPLADVNQSGESTPFELFRCKERTYCAMYQLMEDRRLLTHLIKNGANVRINGKPEEVWLSRSVLLQLDARQDALMQDNVESLRRIKSA